MRLQQFYIGHHRVLHDLQIDFSRTPEPLADKQQYALDFLVGVNGTGKSSVLQLLGMLFARLHQQSAAAYQFPVPIDLTYTIQRDNGESDVRLCNIKHIVAELEVDAESAAIPEILNTLHYQKDGSNTWQDGGLGPLEPDYLPHVVVYSTGRLADWRLALAEQSGAYDEEISDELADEISASETTIDTLFEWPDHWIEPETKAERGRSRMTLIEPDRLPLVALCGLIADRWETKSRRLSYVLQEAQVEALLGFSLRLRYHEGLNHPDVEMWINDLTTIATRVIQQGPDRLLIFEMPQDTIDDNGKLQLVSLEEQIFGKLFNTPLQMFEALYALYEHEEDADCPVREVNLFLKRSYDTQTASGHSMLHLFRWLSDGEQSLLARMALLSLFRDHNLLILLDEPEVHFNDVWKREIIHVLDKIMAGYHSHTLIATHSSIALSDVPKDDILVLHRDGRYTSRVHSPIIQTFGADPSDILVHVFGAPSASGERSVTYIQTEIANRRERTKLEDLEKIVAPGYWRYRIQLEKQRLRTVGDS